VTIGGSCSVRTSTFKMVLISKQAAGGSGVAAGPSSTAWIQHTDISAEHPAGGRLIRISCPAMRKQKGVSSSSAKAVRKGHQNAEGARLGENRLGMGSCQHKTSAIHTYSKRRWQAPAGNPEKARVAASSQKAGAKDTTDRSD